MQKLKSFISLILSVTLMHIAVPVKAESEISGRRMENLDRGLVAMMTDNGVYMTWRLLEIEEYDTTFDVYRDGELIAENISDSTNYLDEHGQQGSKYKIVSSNENPTDVTKAVSPFDSGKII